MDIESFVARLDSTHELPSGISARCPAHDDHVSSLMVDTGRDGGIVVKCHAGCQTVDILRALGLSFKDIMGSPTRVALYEYRDEQGELRYAVERWANPKTFRCVPGLPAPAQRILYQAAALAWARATGETVYVVEGEKDVHSLMDLGLIATCNAGGAGVWLPGYSEQLRGCVVIVVADNDVPGRAHARSVAAALRGYAREVSTVVPMVGKDVTDMLESGYGIEGLDPLPEHEEIMSYVAADVPSRKVSWAWHNYFPLGKLSLVEGDPGDGKSIMTIDLAARWSTGAPMPDGTNGAGPWPVILVSAEDDKEDTIRPRLEAAGAKLSDVHLITHGVTADLPFEFSSGLQRVEYLARTTGARAIFFDPLMAFIGGDTDTHNDSSVRRALQPLKALAERTRAAVIAVRHLNKGGQGTKAIYRGGGSIAFTGAARATFLVTADRNDPANKVFAAVKTNLARRPPSLAYRVESNAEDIPYIVWGGVVGVDAQGALDGPPRMSEASEEASEDRSRKREKRRICEEWLVALLADGDPLAFPEIAEAGALEGFTKRQLRDALDGVHAEQVRGSGGNRSTRWTLQRVSGVDSIPTSHFPTFHPGVAVVSGTQIAESGKVGTREPVITGTIVDASTTDGDQDAVLESLPLECQVCASTDPGVGRYGKPYWTVRCPAHNPFTYAGDR